ncbi:hypothetical protein [Pedobacter terrae]|uniref:hypothetical protein n=1 Tax=Pedobacter terrae TaxID=405671 RepID=UPI002FFA9C30
MKTKFAFQQDTTKFTATLFDENQVPLRGVTVKVKRTGSTSVSNRDGIFSISAQKDDLLLLSLNAKKFFEYKVLSLTENTIVVNSKM